MTTNKLTFQDKNYSRKDGSKHFLKCPESFHSVLKVTVEKLNLSEEEKSFLLALSKKLTQSVHHHGSQRVIDTIRNSRVYLYQGKAGMKPVFKRDGISRSRDGLPKILNKIRKSLRNETNNSFRGLMTVYQLSYILKGDKSPNLDSVVKPNSYDKNFNEEFCQFIKSFKNDFIDGDDLAEWSEPHFTPKSGPNGQAMASCGVDLSLLPQSLIDQQKILGGKKFCDYIDYGRNFPSQLTRVSRMLDPKYKTRNSPVIRKITYVDSPEGKKRVIAIFDYWSQTVLKPLHDGALAQLRKIPQDCTFNQNKAKTDFEWSYAASIDLSAATDRFPIGTQSTMLKELIGEQKTAAWEKILIDYEFSVSWSNEYVKYSSGQPMGAYSSGAVFSLTHHLIIQYSAHKAGTKLPFEEYRLLGDDVVIFNKEVAFQYGKIIQSLGVEISQQKSLQSKYCYEFAKRFFTRTSELSAFPAAAIVEAKSLSEIWAAMITGGEKGYDFAKGIIRPGSTADFAVAMNNTHKRFKAYKHASLLESLLILSDTSTDKNDYNGAVNSIINHLDIPFTCNNSGSEKELITFRLILYFMHQKILSQLESSSKIHNVEGDKVLRHPAFDTDLMDRDDHTPSRILSTESPQLRVLSKSIEGSQAMAYEVKELMNRLQGEGDPHLGLENPDQKLRLLPLVRFQGFPEHTNQVACLSVLKRAVQQPPLDMSSLISRRPNQRRVTFLNAFVKDMIDGVKSSNIQRRAALS